MKIIKEDSGSYQIFAREWLTPTNKTGKCVGYAKSLKDAFDFVEKYIRDHGREATFRVGATDKTYKDIAYREEGFSFLEINPLSSKKPLTYEYYGPRSGKVTGSHSEIRDLHTLDKLRDKYLGD